MIYERCAAESVRVFIPSGKRRTLKIRINHLPLINVNSMQAVKFVPKAAYSGAGFLIDLHIFLQSYIHAHTRFFHTFSHTPATALLVLAWPLTGVVLTDTQVPVVTDSHILKQESCCQAFP